MFKYESLIFLFFKIGNISIKFKKKLELFSLIIQFQKKASKSIINVQIVNLKINSFFCFFQMEKHI